MAKDIKARVQDSFHEDDRENVFKYLDWTRSTLLDYSQSTRRTSTIMLLVVAVFELVVSSRNSSISISSLRVTRSSVAFEALPVLLAFFFLQQCIESNKADQLFIIFAEAFKIWSQKGEDNDLNV